MYVILINKLLSDICYRLKFSNEAIHMYTLIRRVIISKQRESTPCPYVYNINLI